MIRCYRDWLLGVLISGWLLGVKRSCTVEIYQVGTEAEKSFIKNLFDQSIFSGGAHAEIVGKW